MKVDYAVIRIQVLAEESVINSQNELALSDALYELTNKLENWLEHQRTIFDFRLEDS